MPIDLLTILVKPVQALGWLGRQGARAVAILVFVGVVAPPIGTVLKSFVTEAIFLLLCISFARLDVLSLRKHLQKPGIIVAATAWTSLAVPSIFGVVCLMTGVEAHSPDLFLGLMLQGVAPPMMASPALVALMGLDSTLALIGLVSSTALVPLTAPLFIYAFASSVNTLSPLTLGVKLFAILAGSMFVGLGTRRIVGSATIEKYHDEIDGLNILLMLVFVTAVMSTVASRFIEAPIDSIALTLLAFAVFFALFGLTNLVFCRTDRETAFVFGLMASQRNMGLMLATTDNLLPGLTWFYFALCQLPIYLSPQLLKPAARRLLFRAQFK
jgi:hypothetical protein